MLVREARSALSRQSETPRELQKSIHYKGGSREALVEERVPCTPMRSQDEQQVVLFWGISQKCYRQKSPSTLRNSQTKFCSFSIKRYNSFFLPSIRSRGN